MTFEHSKLPKEASKYLANTGLDQGLIEKYSDIWRLLDDNKKEYISNIKDADEYTAGDMQLSELDIEFESSPYIQRCVQTMRENRQQLEQVSLRTQTHTPVEGSYNLAKSMETLADIEIYRKERNEVNNMLIEKTVNNLRSAERWNTGQQHYLQQQLAELMAKKF